MDLRPELLVRAGQVGLNSRRESTADCGEIEGKLEASNGFVARCVCAVQVSARLVQDFHLSFPGPFFLRSLLVHASA